MISELTDEEILEFLMTSEFSETYRQEEYKFLLHKFRYFYRTLHGNHTRIKGDKDLEIKNLSSSVESMKGDVYKLQQANSVLQDTIDLSKKERDLTWRERWDGKIKQF